MRIFPRIREGWSTVLILLGMLLISSIALRETEIIGGLQIIPLVTVLAFLAGFFLAKSRFGDSTAHVFSLIYGLFVLFVLVGLILPGDLTWRERVADILIRQGTWLRRAIDGGTSRDGVIFVIQTTMVYWLIGYTAAWYTFRESHIWRVVIPSGIVLLSVVYYYNGPKPLPLYLGGFVLLALLFIVRTHLTSQEDLWRSASVRYERGIWFDFLRAGFITAALILFLSWSLPSLSASPLSPSALGRAGGPWREFQDTWTRLFSSLRSYGTATSDPYQDTLVLGGPRTVGSTPIMDVFVDERLTSVYWRAVVYDTYENGLWSLKQDNETTLHYPDDGPLALPKTNARQNVTQTILNYLPNSSFLYAAPDVVETDRQMFVDAGITEQGQQLVTAVRSRYLLRQQDSYEVTSSVSTADAQSLRNASTDYPDWVTDYYFQLPTTITPETVALAEDVAGSYDNAFDKSIAIRDYLRDAITYNDQIPAPPEGVDPVHYTLFESREGYCNYYASAMAIMLRSQGVPARVASGFAQGDFNEDNNAYRVRASNAHTWTEVYFPEYGWIQFEPTASIPTVDRDTTGGGGDPFAPLQTDEEREREQLGADLELPEGDGLNLDELLNENDPQQRSTTFLNGFPIWQALGAVVVLLLAGAVMFIAYEMNKRVESDVDRSYDRLSFWARWMGIFFRPTQTPYERADMLTTAVPEGHEPIRNLTRQFVHKQFGPNHNSDDAFKPRDEWRALRPMLIRESLKARLQKVQKRLSRK